MEIITMIILGIVWYAIGVWGFVYWWTKDFDLGMVEVLIMLLAGCVGILSWLIGLGIHGDKTKNKVIIMHRRTK